MTRIFTCMGAVCVASSYEDAARQFGYLSATHDITDRLIALCESRLGPWPKGGMLVHLTPDDMDAIKAQEAREQDLSWSRAEAQGLAERLNEAVLEKARLQVEVLRLSTDNNALGSSRAHLESELAKARELIALYEDDAAREAQAEEEIEAQMMRDAEAFTMKHPMDGLAPAVTYETPVEPGGIYDESGFLLGSTAPVPQEAAMPFEAPPPDQAVRDILKREWPAGTSVKKISAMISGIQGAPSWTEDNKRLGMEAFRMGLRRPAGYAGTRKNAPATVAQDAAATSAPVAAPVIAPAVSDLTRQYGPYVEKLVAKGLSYDDIKRRMNKDLPRDFTREDVKLIAEELGL